MIDATTPSLDWITRATPIVDLHFLSTRCRNALVRPVYGDGINTVGDMLELTETELLRFPNLGKFSLAELKTIRRHFSDNLPRTLNPDADDFHQWCECNRVVLEMLRLHWSQDVEK